MEIHSEMVEYIRICCTIKNKVGLIFVVLALKMDSPRDAQKSATIQNAAPSLQKHFFTPHS